MLSITKYFEFEAAHFLLDYAGKCCNLHGHTYKLEVEICGPSKGEESPKGMVYDFGDLKSLVNEVVLNKLDHSCLNDTFVYPTAENVVKGIVTNLTEFFRDNLVRVRLWETSNSYAEWKRDENK